jgi:hypothetical protein
MVVAQNVSDPAPVIFAESYKSLVVMISSKGQPIAVQVK